MSIPVVEVLRRNPLKPNESGKWYLCSKSRGTVTEKEIAKQMVRRTNLNQKAAEIAILELRNVLIENLLRGYTINIEEIGTFYTTVKSESSDTPEEANKSKVKCVRLHMRLHNSFEKELQQATFEQWNKK